MGLVWLVLLVDARLRFWLVLADGWYVNSVAFFLFVDLVGLRFWCFYSY